MSQPVIIAKIGAPHGIRGDLKLLTFTENPDSILDFKVFELEHKPNQFKPLPDHRIFRKGDGFFIAFEHCKDRDIARQQYTNKHLAVSRDELGEAAEGEIFWRDLEGLTVINQEGVELGKVDHLFDTGSNDVLVLKGEKPHLIPYVDQHVLYVDLEKSIISVDWDEDF